jgi:hypothetical protein
VRIYLTIQNYRCFVQPVAIEVASGFVAFVGVNNSGKSALMRFLLECRQILANLRDHGLLIATIRKQSVGINFLHLLDPNEVFSNRNADPIRFSFRFEYEDAERPKLHSQAVEEYRFIINRNMQISCTILLGDQVLGIGQNTSFAGTHLRFDNRSVLDVAPLWDVSYSLANTLYIGPFRNAINVGGRTEYLDIQIGQNFIAQFRNLKTGPIKQQNVGISRLTDDIRRVFRFDTLDISPTHDDTSLHFTVNGKPYKQHEVGSGLAQFVVVLANAAIKKPNWILIDEPELNLHPALQLDFLTTLAGYAEKGIWFSTHSVGLARSAASRVYSVSRLSEGDSTIRPLEGTPRLSEFLGEMSFSSQKELGFETVLLVEGPTEVPTFQQFLRMICKDHKILLLPLHGHMPNAQEIEELLRITPNLAALIDSERDSPGASLERSRAEFIEFCINKKLKVKALEWRATENYFSDPAIKKSFGDQFRALGHYERLKDANPRWGKSQNWKIASNMTFEEIRSTDLGEFLSTLCA